jgi:putative ABC transport system permease protein
MLNRCVALILQMVDHLTKLMRTLNLKSSLRYFRRTSVYSLLNTTGLVFGISASAFLFIYVWDELRHDRFHEKTESIFRILTEQQNGTKGVTTPGPLGEMIIEKYSQVADMTRVGKWSGAFQVGELVYEESEVYFTDNAFFRIFDFELLKGDEAHVLKNPTDIVLTEKTAKKFFGDNWATRSDLLGHQITMNGSTILTVVGVAANAPSFSSIQFDYLLSFDFIRQDRWNYQWGSHNFHTYVELKSPSAASSFEGEIKDAIKDTQFNEGFSLRLQPLKNIYMESFAAYDWGRHGDPQYLVAFTIIGVLILLVACFNYINLTMSQAIKRAKEIGIRKVNGASRSNIFLQFMGETIVMVTFAAFIARALVDILLPYFNELSGKRFVIESFQNEIAILFVLLAVVTSIASGVYPAIALARLKSISMIRNSYGPVSKNRLRSILVTSQLTIALILVSVTIMMYTQVDYMKSKNPGFETDQLVYIKLGGALRKNNSSFKDDLLKLSYVQSASRSTTTLVNTDNGSYVEWPGKKQGEEITVTQMNVDSDFLPMLGIKLQSGRNFAPSDSNSYILNQTAVRAMGLTTDKALGMKIKFWGTEGLVIGVVDDFHYRPLHHSIAPLVLRHNLKENYYQLLVTVDAGKIEELRKDASMICKKYEDVFPFSYGHFDESLDGLYKVEQRVSDVTACFQYSPSLFHYLELSASCRMQFRSAQKNSVSEKYLVSTSHN